MYADIINSPPDQSMLVRMITDRCMYLCPPPPPLLKCSGGLTIFVLELIKFYALSGDSEEAFTGFFRILGAILFTHLAASVLHQGSRTVRTAAYYQVRYPCPHRHDSSAHTAVATSDSLSLTVRSYESSGLFLCVRNKKKKRSSVKTRYHIAKSYLCEIDNSTSLTARPCTLGRMSLLCTL